VERLPARRRHQGLRRRRPRQRRQPLVRRVPPYANALPAVTTPPAVAGTAQTGSLLAATAGEWGGGKPASFAYQWQRCDTTGAGCTPIAGATAETYTPAAADAAHTLVVVVTVRTAAGSASASSQPTAVVGGGGAPPAAAPNATTLPALQGTPQAGQTLTATPGKWTGSPTQYAYQWRRCSTSTACLDITGATTRSYVATPDDIGAALAVAVTATGRGGSRSVSSTLSAIVAAAPTPTPAVGSAVAQAGQAGAVTSDGGAATATWQPGAVPPQTSVALQPSASRLALPSTPLALTLGATAPLPWPVDVSYPSAPPDAVAGFLPGAGIWQPLPQLSSPSLPAGQEFGTYRDAGGALHVLTRVPGRVALFAPAKWGDPRFTSARRPTLALVSPLVATRSAGGSFLLRGRFTLDSQAHLYASILGPGGKRLLLPQHGSRLGWWLQGRPTKTFQTLQLRPGEMPIRVRIHAHPATTYTLRLVAIDPYGRNATLTAPIAVG